MLRVSEEGGRRRGAHAAGYGELGLALLDLQAAANQVFGAVSKRTAEERDKLSGISRRIKAAKAKIKALSQSEEPLTIVSPARHPSSSTKQEDFKPLFHCKYGDTNGGLPIANIAINAGFNREYGLEGTLELFQFFSEENCDYLSKEPAPKVICLICAGRTTVGERQEARSSPRRGPPTPSPFLAPIVAQNRPC